MGWFIGRYSARCLHVQFNCLVPSSSLQKTPWPLREVLDHTEQESVFWPSYNADDPSLASGSWVWVVVLDSLVALQVQMVLVPGHWHLWWSCWYVLQLQHCRLCMSPTGALWPSSGFSSHKVQLVMPSTMTVRGVPSRISPLHCLCFYSLLHLNGWFFSGYGL